MKGQIDDAVEPIHDLAHLGHLELLTPKPEESLHFFTNVLGMSVTARAGQSVFLRGYGDYERHTVKLTEDCQAGIAHIAWRTTSRPALVRRVAALEAAGCGRGWIDGDLGHGPAYRFVDPDGHLMELYYETEYFQAPADQRSRLKNQPQRYSGHGIGIRRIDHVNLLCQEVMPNRVFMEEKLGFRLREHVILDDGTEAAAWISVTPLVHDVAYTLDATRSRGRLHHLAFWVDNREDVLRAADIFLENDVFIESGPSKHAITQAFFLYGYEPGGNRVEIFSGGYLIFAPDWQPIVWTQAERARGQAWGLRLPESFHSYGTPIVEVTREAMREVPVFDPR
ncbi:MAG TPA: catechol 2,3-dioxygenase [Chloroflexota bacterium]|nr:catechol 2,3-dioxygenase [Chloroflexota bacterium]